MRTCSNCKIEKDLDEFHKKGKGHQHICKECRKIYIKEHYQKNKGTYIAKAKESKSKKYQWLKDYKSKLQCIKCGESHIACLHFHHKDPDKKLFTIGRMMTFAGEKRIKEEMDKCDILCANCHAKLHWEQNH